MPTLTRPEKDEDRVEGAPGCHPEGATVDM